MPCTRVIQMDWEHVEAARLQENACGDHSPGRWVLAPGQSSHLASAQIWRAVLQHGLAGQPSVSSRCNPQRRLQRLQQQCLHHVGTTVTKARCNPTPRATPCQNELGERLPNHLPCGLRSHVGEACYGPVPVHSWMPGLLAPAGTEEYSTFSPTYVHVEAITGACLILDTGTAPPIWVSRNMPSPPLLPGIAVPWERLG